MGTDAIRLLSNPAFRFTVDISGQTQAAFTECILPEVTLETEEVREGGENTQTILLVGRRQAARVTLRHGVGSSVLLEWYLDILSEKFERRPVTIKILNTRLEPVMSWHVNNAIPVKWSGPQLKAEANSIAIQSLELACGKIQITPG
jgi:phage tail-like protein